MKRRHCETGRIGIEKVTGKTSKNEEFVHMVAEQNVRMTIDDIRKHSPILREMEGKGEIKIVGGLYAMNTGEVCFLDK